ncbi:hypothetical protein [Pseudomonas cavernae]|nr:hypothetical protein [Pseudomonas cavernae]
MEDNQIRRVLVTDASGCCCGIVSQADFANEAQGLRRRNRARDFTSGRYRFQRSSLKSPRSSLRHHRSELDRPSALRAPYPLNPFPTR